MADVPMILLVHAEYGDVWTRAGELRLQSAKRRGDDVRKVEGRIIAIADKWSRRQFIRDAARG